MNRFLCAAVLSTLAIDTLAASVHHKHSHQHEKKQVDFNDPSLYADVDWSSVFGTDEAATTATAAAKSVVETATAAVTTEATTSSSSSSSSIDSTSSGSSDELTGFGGVTTPVDNGNVDQYIGNVGNPYGSNIIKISKSDAGSYKYTNKYENQGSSALNIIVWNKSGPDGQANSGQFSTPALSFPLAAGATQYVAFDENSQVAFCSDSGAKTQWGANDCTYGEADFGNLSNGGWSGYDVSSIQSTTGNNTPMSISSPNGATSSNLGNNYVSDTQPGGIGGNLAPGSVELTTIFG